MDAVAIVVTRAATKLYVSEEYLCLRRETYLTILKSVMRRWTSCNEHIVFAHLPAGAKDGDIAGSACRGVGPLLVSTITAVQVRSQ